VSVVRRGCCGCFWSTGLIRRAQGRARKRRCMRRRCRCRWPRRSCWWRTARVRWLARKTGVRPSTMPEQCLATTWHRGLLPCVGQERGRRRGGNPSADGAWSAGERRVHDVPPKLAGASCRGVSSHVDVPGAADVRRPAGRRPRAWDALKAVEPQSSREDPVCIIHRTLARRDSCALQHAGAGHARRLPVPARPS
jgi:hypothetical protein